MHASSLPALGGQNLGLRGRTSVPVEDMDVGYRRRNRVYGLRCKSTGKSRTSTYIHMYIYIIMLTSYSQGPPPPHPRRDVIPNLRNKSPDPASEPLTSRSLKSFSVPLIFQLIKQDSGYIFSAPADWILQIRGVSHYVLGIGFRNYAGDSRYEVDINIETRLRKRVQAAIERTGFIGFRV